MPRGRPKKTQEAEIESPQTSQDQEAKEAGLLTAEPEAKPDPRNFREKPAAPLAQKIAESRKFLDQPLAPGQRLFESPEGIIMIGEADRDHVWCRDANGGKGAFINPRR